MRAGEYVANVIVMLDLATDRGPLHRRRPAPLGTRLAPQTRVYGYVPSVPRRSRSGPRAPGLAASGRARRVGACDRQWPERDVERCESVFSDGPPASALVRGGAWPGARPFPHEPRHRRLRLRRTDRHRYLPADPGEAVIGARAKMSSRNGAGPELLCCDLEGTRGETCELRLAINKIVTARQRLLIAEWRHGQHGVRG